MRIIAGKHRGRALAAPEGSAVRPTSDRAREALFDILAHGRFADRPVFEEARVLDAFAGTGAFGLEALSRGAAHASFIEKDRAALKALSANIKALGEERHAAVLPGDALHPPRPAAAASLAFLDPPYGEDVAAAALTALAEAGWLAPDALAVVEVAAKREVTAPPGFTLLEERRYGAAKLAFLRFAPARGSWC
ncbi:MAG TPA: 16S rRNA (guanine(966)-N(2))-methyltransferase RsmD [Stellaceae bacterium]|nr:16S rRNA (guanine(966)-N(2))-methyltransferase RsmD [Stellaceae bacterium]